jgi:predicted nuclease of predicted toxin-antitoxin system
MRVLLDEHLPHRLRRLLGPAIEVVTIAHLGWKGTRNGALIRAAEDDFDVFVTMDQGIPHQQNLSGIKLRNRPS